MEDTTGRARPTGEPMQLTQHQVSVLERLRSRGFVLVAFPMYATYVGVRKGNCAALLAPEASGGLHVFGEPCYLVGGNLSARIARGGRQWFVWKKEKLEATPARLAELRHFTAELLDSLLPSA
jgi:hypothetical protein